MIQRIASTLLIALLCATALHAQPAVRVLFVTGSVTLKGKKVSIGQQLTSRDVLTIGKSSTLQLSINGRVLRYNKSMKLKVSDAVRQAGSGENSAVATTVRTLAAASGAGSSGRSSQAGATRFDGDSSTEARELARQAEKDVRFMADAEIERRIGIGDGVAIAEQALRDMYGEDDMVILEPRASGVTSGAIRFRWLASPTASGYVVTLYDHLGDKLFETETADTTAVWQSPTLLPGVVYTWRLSDRSNNLHRTGARFHCLDSQQETTLRAGQKAIEKELGDDNPALPLVLGGWYCDNDCPGQGSRYFVEGAERTPQLYGEFMGRAVECYSSNIMLSPHELALVYRQRR